MKKRMLAACLLLAVWGCTGIDKSRGSLTDPDHTLQLVVVEHNPLGVEGQTDFTYQPVSGATVLVFSGDLSEVVTSGHDGTIPRPLDNADLLIMPAEMPAVLYSGWHPLPRILVLGETAVPPATVAATSEAAFVAGQVARYTPSTADYQSIVRVWWRNADGVVMDEEGQKASRQVATQNIWSLDDNRLELWLPAGDNELFVFEQIVRKDNPAVFNLGRASYAPVYSVSAGFVDTDTTFLLDRDPDQSSCPQNGALILSWPGLDRSFIRASSGGVDMRLDLELPGGLLASLAAGHFDHHRIQSGNVMKLFSPLPLTGALAGAQYHFRSAATRQTEAELWERIRQGEKVSSTMPCAFTMASPSATPPLDYPLPGVTLTVGTEWTWRWQVKSDTSAQLSPLFTFSKAEDQSPVLRMVINTYNQSSLSLDKVPWLERLLADGDYLLHVETEENVGAVASWMADPIVWNRQQKSLYVDWLERQTAWETRLALHILNQ